MNQPARDLTILGRTNARQPHKTFGIKQPDRLFHQYLIGQTGTGKSTLALSMMQQDLAAGRGFCLIDPHGDLAESVRASGAGDTIYWDAADPDCPYGYNPITTVSRYYRPLVTSGLIETLQKQWADAWGPRMEHLLRFALLALLERPGSTIADIMPLFTDKAFRKEVIFNLADDQTIRFWRHEFPAMSYKTAADGAAPIANKLGAFLAHPVVRRSICEPTEPLRFRQIMDEGKVLIVNLAKGKLGTDVSNILGGLLISSIALAAYSRVFVPEAERRPFYLYVDEFQSFTTEAYAGMLSELRKFKCALVLLHQYTAQLDKTVFEAILGNVGTLMAFRIGATDAPVIAKQLAGRVPEPRDLVNLANYELFIKLMIDGNQSQPFSGTTLPPKTLNLRA